MFTLKRLFLLTLLIMIPHFAMADNWKIDPAHTAVEFKVKHLMISWVKGVFTEIEGTAVIDEKALDKASVKVQIQTASIDTNNKKRDDHLRSPDFFDVAAYPAMTFVSKEAVIIDGKPAKVIGDLTIRDVTREVALEVEDFSQTIKDPWGNTRRGATLSTEINRKEYGLTWSKTLETGGFVVGDEVRITLEVELIKGE
jgi:polyisoprenoid-binding protein YceI